MSPHYRENRSPNNYQGPSSEAAAMDCLCLFAVAIWQIMCSNVEKSVHYTKLSLRNCFYSAADKHGMTFLFDGATCTIDAPHLIVVTHAVKFHKL